MRFIYSYRKMAKLSANSGDPDQMPHSVTSDLGLQLPFLGSPDYNGLTKQCSYSFYFSMKTYVVDAAWQGASECTVLAGLDQQDWSTCSVNLSSIKKTLKRRFLLYILYKVPTLNFNLSLVMCPGLHFVGFFQ